MSEKLPNNPNNGENGDGGNWNDFSKLGNWALTDIATSPDSTPEDIENAEAEIARREEAGTYNLDEDNPTDLPTDNPPEDAPADSPDDNPVESPTNPPSDTPNDDPADQPTDNPPADAPANVPADPPVHRSSIDYGFRFVNHRQDDINKKNETLKHRKNRETILKIIAEETPTYDDFIGVYSQEEMAADAEKVKQIKDEILEVEGKHLSRNTINLESSKMLEFVIAEYIGTSQDWFHEAQRGDDFISDKGDNLFAFPTHEFDDFIHHSDITCVINNKDTNFQPIPFILDATFNIDEEKLQKKMDWHHPIAHSKGFMAIKYFYDKGYDSGLPKGSIAIAPRFVVGCNPKLAREICEYRIAGPDDRTSTAALNTCLNKVKWCVLSEIISQLPRLKESLNDMTDPKLKEVATRQVSALTPYFEEAYNLALENDATNKNFPQSDLVAQAIERQAQGDKETDLSDLPKP